jgi:phosphoglycolate/pyridoxal phosphate phosphatase family enzyme
MFDVFGKPLEILQSKKVFLLDMDGTLYIDDSLIDGTLDLIDTLHREGRRSIYVTNNSSRSVNDYVAKLGRMGIKSSADEFFTSSMAMALYLCRKYPQKKTYCMGTRSLIQELMDKGIRVTDEYSEDVEVVVLGYDTELTYRKLEDVCRLLKKDLPYLATNPDWVCPVSYGFAPDCGSMAEMIAHATGKHPQFIGKPEPMILLEALRKWNAQPKDAVVVGDRLYTDIQSGLNAGITTLAVLSGETSLEDIAHSSGKPDFVIPSVRRLADLLIQGKHPR